MIESEQKKQRLTDTVTRWCDHTKVTPYLRDYDIPNLVSQVMNDFYHVHLCCGHLVNTIDEGVHLAFKDVDGGVRGLYCQDCAVRYKRELGAWEIGVLKEEEKP